MPPQLCSTMEHCSGLLFLCLCLCLYLSTIWTPSPYINPMYSVLKLQFEYHILNLLLLLQEPWQLYSNWLVHTLWQVFTSISDQPQNTGPLAWSQVSSPLNSGLPWSYLWSTTSLNNFTKLQQDPCYKLKELKNFSFMHETKWLDEFLSSKTNPFCSDYGWHKLAMKIKLSRENVTSPISETPWMKIDRVWHQDIVNIITNAFQSEVGLSFNMIPFSQ